MAGLGKGAAVQGFAAAAETGGFPRLSGVAGEVQAQLPWFTIRFGMLMALIRARLSAALLLKA